MAPSAPAVRTGAGLTAARALAERAFRDARVRTISFAYLFAHHRLHPAGRLPRRLPDAIGPARVRPQLRRQQGDPPVLRCPSRPAHRLRLHGLARRRDARDLRRRSSGCSPRSVRCGPRRTPAGWSSCSPARSGDATTYLAAIAAIAAGVLILGLAEFAGLVLSGLPVGRVGRARARDRLDRARVRGCGRARQPARLDTQNGPRARRRAPSDCSWRCESSPTPQRAPAGYAGRRRSDGPRKSARSPAPGRSSCCSPPRQRVAAARARRTDRRPPRHRHRRAPSPRQRPAASRSALLADSRRHCAQSARSLTVWLASIGAFAYITGVIAKSTSTAGISRQPATRGRKARHRLDRYAHRIPRVRVHLLRPGRQPVHVRADRRRTPRGSRRATRDAALAPRQPPQMARREGSCSQPSAPPRSR